MNLNKFGVANFKCFDQAIEIGQRPITINIGPNNSGKSSILQAVKLFKYSRPSKLKTPILSIDSIYLPEVGGPKAFLNNTGKELSYIFTSPLNKLPLQFRKHKVQIKLDFTFFKTIHEVRNSLENITKNKLSWLVLPSTRTKGILTKYSILVDEIKILSFSIDKTKSSISLINDDEGINYEGQIVFSNSEYLNTILNLKNIVYIDFTHNFLTNDRDWVTPEKQRVKKLLNEAGYPIDEFVDLLVNMLKQLSNFQTYLNKLTFIELNRREFKRYVEFKNPSLLNKISNDYFNEGKKGSITFPAIFQSILRDTLPLFGLPNIIKFVHKENVGFQLMIKTQDGNHRNIADFGSGINQLLPLISAISAEVMIKKDRVFDNRLIVAEEPESNLHPKMQSKLADMFTLLCNAYNLNFIIETHSEYMVRRFQYLVATGKLKPEEIIINYFWVTDGVHKCKQIEFKPNGGLSKSFEPGFYEESLSLQLELLKINSLN